MYFKNVTYLKLKDIKGEYVEFIRAKTERATRANPKLKQFMFLRTWLVS